MTKTHTYKGLVWIDLHAPDENEISSTVRRYGLHPLVGEELKNPNSPSRVDFYSNYIAVFLSIPERIRLNGAYSVVNKQIDFIIGENFLITSRNDAIEQLEYFAKIFDANSILDKNEKIEHGGNLFYYMIKRFYAGMTEDLENIKDSLLGAETRIFKGDERRMVEILSNLSREIIDFKQLVRIHEEIWDQMIQNTDKSVFRKEFAPYVKDMRNDFNHIFELIHNARELLDDLREDNNSLLNTKQNEIIRALTLVASIFYPLTFIAALFTIPSPFTPIIAYKHGWNGILGFMIVLSLVMWWYFKRKKWI